MLTSFIQAIAGFGTPLAVVAPILLGLGVKPLYAVLLPIIGGAWANSFGSLGAPWFALGSVVDIPDPSHTARLGALLAWIPNLMAGITIAWLYGRTWALRRGASMSLPVAFAPYIFLGVVALVVLTVTPIRSALETISIGPPFPATDTGFGMRGAAVDAYSAFTPLTHPGTFLLLAALFGYWMFMRRGRYPAGTTVGGVLRRAATDALPVTTSVSALLLMSMVMSHSGEITVLALGCPL